jgi:CheY-like chemotaxis protein
LVDEESFLAAKVLIVEDDADCRDVLCIHLKFAGYEVAEASDAEAGFEKALAEGPDLIIMDLALPGVNGIDATRRLKQDPKTTRIPVIAYTVWDEMALRIEAERAGVAAFLRKPFPPGNFVEVIERILASP